MTLAGAAGSGPGAQPPTGFRQAALLLARQIWDRRVYTRDGTVTWFRPASGGRR
jgi:hypothetical protein